MNTSKDQPSQANSPNTAHVGIEEVVQRLACVLCLHHRVDREDTERHHRERQEPQNCYRNLKCNGNVSYDLIKNNIIVISTGTILHISKNAPF